MDQSTLNWFFGILNLVLGGFIKAMWDSYKDLKQTDAQLAEKVGKIEVLVAGEYVKKDDLDTRLARIEDVLDRIMLKLDTKADK